MKSAHLPLQGERLIAIFLSKIDRLSRIWNVVIAAGRGAEFMNIEGVPQMLHKPLGSHARNGKVAFRSVFRLGLPIQISAASTDTSNLDHMHVTERRCSFCDPVPLDSNHGFC